MLPIDLASLPAAAQKILAPGAPAPIRAMAAKGIIPGLRPGDIVTVVAALSESDAEAIANIAAETLRKLPAPLLDGALAADLETAVIEKLADAYSERAGVVERLLRMPRLGQIALEILAERADELIGELIATNEERMLEFPSVIEKLYMNKRVRMSTADRLLELAVRNSIELSIPAFKEAALAIRNELISEPTPEPAPDDILFQEANELADKLPLDPDEDDTHAVDDEGEEQLKQKFLPLYAKIAAMTPSQKIRRAQLGNSAERLLLVRDPNRLVATAVVKSPSLRENEVQIISGSRSVSQDVLTEIARSREFTRNYQVKLNLVRNPRTAFSFSSRIVTQLRDNDVRDLAKSKNIPSAVRQCARNQIERKKPRG